jgi:hypothetical protein
MSTLRSMLLMEQVEQMLAACLELGQLVCFACAFVPYDTTCMCLPACCVGQHLGAGNIVPCVQPAGIACWHWSCGGLSAPVHDAGPHACFHRSTSWCCTRVTTRSGAASGYCCGLMVLPSGRPCMSCSSQGLRAEGSSRLPLCRPQVFVTWPQCAHWTLPNKVAAPKSMALHVM